MVQGMIGKVRQWSQIPPRAAAGHPAAARMVVRNPPVMPGQTARGRFFSSGLGNNGGPGFPPIAALAAFADETQ
jgi:hypothetical protein